MMKKLPVMLLGLAVLGSLLTLYLYGFDGELRSVTKPNQHKEADPVAKSQLSVAHSELLDTGVDMLVQNPPSKGVKIDSVLENDTVVWVESEQAEQELKTHGKLPTDLDNEAYVELDRQELLSVEKGEYLDLYIPQLGGSYTGEVDHIIEHKNGDRTVEAYIPGAGNLYSAVLTIGKNAVYGTIATQAGVYFMEGKGNYAWIASKYDLVKKHSLTHVDGVEQDSHAPTPEASSEGRLDPGSN